LKSAFHLITTVTDKQAVTKLSVWSLKHFQTTRSSGHSCYAALGFTLYFAVQVDPFKRDQRLKIGQPAPGTWCFTGAYFSGVKLFK